MIIRIQAKWRAHVQLAHYRVKREQGRTKSTHFVSSDQYETVSKERRLDLALLRPESEAELEMQLVTRSHRYAESGSTYEG